MDTKKNVLVLLTLQNKERVYERYLKMKYKRRIRLFIIKICRTIKSFNETIKKHRKNIEAVGLCPSFQERFGGRFTKSKGLVKLLKICSLDNIPVYSYVLDPTSSSSKMTSVVNTSIRSLNEMGLIKCIFENCSDFNEKWKSIIIGSKSL